MADAKPEIKPVLKPTAQPQAEAEVIQIPKEYASRNDAIRITINGDQVTLDMSAAVTQEIGSYRRCKRVQMVFKNGEVPQILVTGI